MVSLVDMDNAASEFILWVGCAMRNWVGMLTQYTGAVTQLTHQCSSIPIANLFIYP